ncbi:hypothetical protein GGR58DRAFT_527321 [Xylaria digitata]|nr:hypothetical protein GGR58DRAFT_527321 [Xylaria digitata]
MAKKRTRLYRGFSSYKRCIDGIRTRFIRDRPSSLRLSDRLSVATQARSSSRSSLSSEYSVSIRYRRRPAGPGRRRGRHAMPRSKVLPPLPRRVPTQSNLPQWFLDNCVRTLDELRNDGNAAIIPLAVSDGKGHQSHPAPEHVDLATGSGDHGVGRGAYEINRALWNVMLGLLAPPEFSTPESSDTSSFVSNLIDPEKIKGPRGFQNDAAHIRFPEARAKGGNGFLLAVTQRLACEADAHLITLSIDDVDDLAEHFLRKAEPELVGSWKNPLEVYFLHTAIKNTSNESLRRELASHSLEFPLKTILSAGDKKASVGGSKLNQEHPVVVYIPHVDTFHGDLQRCVLRGLQDASSSIRRQVLVLSSTNQALHTLPGSEYNDDDERRGVGGTQDPSSEEYGKNDKPIHSTRRHDFGVFGQKTVDSAWEATILSDTGKLPRQAAICVAPIRSGRQKSFFDTNVLFARSHESANVRLVQRCVRRCSAAHAQMALFKPYATWEFLSGTPMQNLVRKETLDEEEAMQVASSIVQALNEDDIKSAILDMGALQVSSLEGLGHLVHRRGSPEEFRSLLRYSVAVQNQIRKIEASESGYPWENRFLSLLIAPTEVEEGMTEIALDPDVREEILQLVKQWSADGSTYGVLKNGRVGGALLYGPPGAGKTHLTRILVRESKSPFLSVSAAELMSKWIGNTEKAIQGLFNLARMLAPSIIFVDEAGALFMPRHSGERSWERSKANQLLQEMDGVRKSDKEPFVLLATNFPRQLDHAVLRRVPSHIFMGMPTCEQRLQILSDDVDLA